MVSEELKGGVDLDMTCDNSLWSNPDSKRGRGSVGGLKSFSPSRFSVTHSVSETTTRPYVVFDSLTDHGTLGDEGRTQDKGVSGLYVPLLYTGPLVCEFSLPTGVRLDPTSVLCPARDRYLEVVLNCGVSEEGFGDLPQTDFCHLVSRSQVSPLSSVSGVFDATHGYCRSSRGDPFSNRTPVPSIPTYCTQTFSRIWCRYTEGSQLVLWTQCPFDWHTRSGTRSSFPVSVSGSRSRGSSTLYSGDDSIHAQPHFWTVFLQFHRLIVCLSGFFLKTIGSIIHQKHFQTRFLSELSSPTITKIFSFL